MRHHDAMNQKRFHWIFTAIKKVATDFCDESRDPPMHRSRTAGRDIDQAALDKAADRLERLRQVVKMIEKPLQMLQGVIVAFFGTADERGEVLLGRVSGPWFESRHDCRW